MQSDTRQEGSGAGSPLPPRATGLLLGLWVAALLILAFGVVPLLFDTCAGRT